MHDGITFYPHVVSSFTPSSHVLFSCMAMD